MFKKFESGPTIRTKRAVVEYPGCMLLVNTQGCSEGEGVLLALSEEPETARDLCAYRLSLSDDVTLDLLTTGSYIDYTSTFRAIETPWR